MTLLEKAQKPPTKSKGIAALIVATLGTMGIMAFYFFGSRELQGLDMAMLFIALGFAAYGTMRSIIRGLMTAVAVYLATGIAANFYPILTPYSRSFLNVLGTLGLSSPPIGAVDYSALALSFAVMTAILWIILELLFRAAFPDAHLSFLGPLDRLGGALVYLVIGIMVATLLFNTIGYGVAGRVPHNQASFRSTFNRLLQYYYQAQSFWFPGRPPAIYVYDLDLS